MGLWVVDHLGGFQHPAQGKREHCVDATAERAEFGIGRLLSHTMRAPNLTCKAFLVDDVPRLLLIARTDIAPDTELSFDYGDRRAGIAKTFAWLLK